MAGVPADAVAIEFAGPDRGEVLAAMRTLAADRSGWINLSPLIDADRLPPRGGAPGIFSARGPLVPLATWVPGERGRKPSPSSLGLQHPLGTKAARALADLGIAVPTGYRVVADHARRGIVMEADDPGDPDEVLEWMVRTTGATCPIEFDGCWVAGVVRR